MAKLFRFLVTIPADCCPTPVKADMVEEVHLNLSRYYNKVKVSALRRNETVMPVRPFQKRRGK